MMSTNTFLVVEAKKTRKQTKETDGGAKRWFLPYLYVKGVRCAKQGVRMCQYCVRRACSADDIPVSTGAR